MTGTSDTEQWDKLRAIHQDVLNQTYEVLGGRILTPLEKITISKYHPNQQLPLEKRILKEMRGVRSPESLI